MAHDLSTSEIIGLLDHIIEDFEKLWDSENMDVDAKENDDDLDDYELDDYSTTPTIAVSLIDTVLTAITQNAVIRFKRSKGAKAKEDLKCVLDTIRDTALVPQLMSRFGSLPISTQKRKLFTDHPFWHQLTDLDVNLHLVQPLQRLLSTVKFVFCAFLPRYSVTYFHKHSQKSLGRQFVKR